MRLLVTILFALFNSILFSQDSCENYRPDCHYCEWPSVAYHENRKLAFKSKENRRGVRKWKKWDCHGNVIRKVKSYPWRYGKKNWKKHWFAEYYENGQLKSLKVDVTWACLKIRRRRFKQFDENGNRIRE